MNVCVCFQYEMVSVLLDMLYRFVSVVPDKDNDRFSDGNYLNK